MEKNFQPALVLPISPDEAKRHYENMASVSKPLDVTAFKQISKQWFSAFFWLNEGHKACTPDQWSVIGKK